MSAPTPMPWLVETDTAIPLVVNSDGWPILISGGVRQIGVSYDENRKRLIADVRLAAAAPDLLEALKLADAALSGANMNMNVVQRKVHDAIAKAEGRS